MKILLKAIVLTVAVVLVSACGQSESEAIAEKIQQEQERQVERDKERTEERERHLDKVCGDNQACRADPPKPQFAGPWSCYNDAGEEVECTEDMEMGFRKKMDECYDDEPESCYDMTYYERIQARKSGEWLKQ